jgi:hypothetical protein
MAARKKRVSRSPIERDSRRPEIEKSLAMGVAVNQVARKFGYTPQSILRFRNRMPQQLKAAIVAATLKPKEADLDKLRIDESEGILGNLASQRARLLLCQDQCMENGAVTQVGYLSNIIHRNIELTGKYLGLFAQHHVSTNVNILLSEDYLRLRQKLILALRPFPEARQAVAAALQQVEGSVAQKMLQQAGKAPPGAVIDHLASDTGSTVPDAQRPSSGAAEASQP